MDLQIGLYFGYIALLTFTDRIILDISVRY